MQIEPDGIVRIELGHDHEADHETDSVADKCS